MSKRIAIFTVIGVSAALPLTPQAHAAYDPLGSGQTKLILDKRLTRFLAQAGVKLSASQGAKRTGQKILLPVSGGQIDPTTGKGEVDQAGTLTFESEAKRVPLRGITVKTKHQPLIAKVGGSQLKVASASKISSSRAGFGMKFTAKQLKLSAKAATRLNKKLRAKPPFEAGQVIGDLISTPQPQLVAILDTGRATLTLDPGFLAKLDERFISLNPIAPAERLGSQASFPIAVGGAIAPDGSEGTLRTGGALEFLQLGSGQVFWSELWLDLAAHSDTAEVDVEPTPTFPGKIGRVGVLDYAPTTVSSDPKARTISVSGAPLTLSAAAAATFNEAFAQGEGPAFSAGEAAGAVSFSAVAQ